MDLQTEITRHDLKLLSIGHYIHGGIVGFYTLIALAYLGLFGTIMSSVISQQKSDKDIPPAVISIVITVFGGIALLLILYVIGVMLAAHWLRQRRNSVFIQIIAVLNCLFIPYGTALGVFTFIVLGRPEARAMFTAPYEPFAVAQSPQFTSPSQTDPSDSDRVQQ